MYDLVIRGGRIIVQGDMITADVAVSGARIAALGLNLNGERVLNATGCYVLPGAVDPHVHLQMKLGGRTSSDSFNDGTLAAVCGGTTTVIDFIDPQPGERLMAALAARRREADGQVSADYGLHMTIPTWHAGTEDRLSELPQVVAAGCPTFKLYQAYAGMALDDVALLRTMKQVANAAGRVVLHSEIGPVLDSLRADALKAGHTAPIWHERTRPPTLEASAVHRAVALAALADCPLHIFHVGAQKVVEEITRMQARGYCVTAETCPHYLCLTAAEHLAGGDGALYVCAPPLRAATDHLALWRALAGGSLDVVSTDHCPWLRGEKQAVDFTLIPGGLPGIEARLSLIHHLGVCDGHLSLPRWVEVCCTRPAEIVGLNRKGKLAPGYDADIVLFDPERRKELAVHSLHETAGWTPYEGMVVRGWPRTVLLRGRIVVRDEGVVEERGGQFVERRFGYTVKTKNLSQRC